MSLTLNTQDVGEWWIFLHSPNMMTSPITKAYGGNFIRLNAVDGKSHGVQHDYEVSRIEMHVMDQEDDPCLDLEPVDRDGCIGDYISSKGPFTYDTHRISGSCDSLPLVTFKQEGNGPIELRAIGQ